MTILFEHMTPRRDEYGTSRDIEAIRFVNGDVNVIIGTWDERSDKTTKGYLLSADDAARFGRALCEVADPFDGLVERATRAGEQTEVNTHEIDEKTDGADEVEQVVDNIYNKHAIGSGVLFDLPASVKSIKTVRSIVRATIEMQRGKQDDRRTSQAMYQRADNEVR